MVLHYENNVQRDRTERFNGITVSKLYCIGMSAKVSRIYLRLTASAATLSPEASKAND